MRLSRIASLISLILDHDLVREVSNFSGSWSNLLHRLCQIGEIAHSAVTARHAVHRNAHFLDAFNQRGCGGIGRRNVRRRAPNVGHEAELRVRDIGDDVTGGVRIIEGVGFDGAATFGHAPLAVDFLHLRRHLLRPVGVQRLRLRQPLAVEGAITLGHDDGGAFYRKVLAAPETLNPYGTKQVPPKVEEVDGKWSTTEGGRTIEAYSLDNPHSTGYIIPYIPDAKLGFVTDIWSPAQQMPPANPGTTALVKGVQKMGIQMDRMAGGHGGVGNFADLAKTVQ